MKNRIIIEKYEGSLNSEFIKTLEEILDWFNYSVVFKGNKIYLTNESGYRDFDQIYTNDINGFINDWITTLEDAMQDDEEIDYNDWNEILKSNLMKL